MCISSYDELLGHPVLGKSWEGFVIENILSAVPTGVQCCFYRTAAGAEIDLLLEFGLDDYRAIEVKASRAPTLKKGFYQACQDLAARRKFLVYTGEETFQADNDTTVISIANFIEVLRSQR